MKLQEVSPAAGGGLRRSDVIGRSLNLVLNNSMQAVTDGRRAIEAHVAPLALSPMVLNRLEVVFEELISNIVRHGFTPGSSQMILVRVEASSDAIELVIEDDGEPFNLLEAPAPPPLQSLESARLGGLGIVAVRKMAAEIRYDGFAPGAASRLIDGRPFNPRNRVSLSIVGGQLKS